ncbi:MAG: prepilin peptidase [Candidatus Baltobacteraceae bacterium]
MIGLAAAIVFSVTALAAAACAATAVSERCGVTVRLFAPVSLTVLIGSAALASYVAAGKLPAAAAVVVIACACCAVCAVCDAQTGYVFDAVTLPALGSIVLLSSLQNAATPALTGMLLAAGALFVLFAASHGRALGFGDVKLAAVLGAAMGSAEALPAIGLAFIAGGAHAAYLLLSRKAGRGDAMPFAPYLSGALFCMLLSRTTA